MKKVKFLNDIFVHCAVAEIERGVFETKNYCGYFNLNYGDKELIALNIDILAEEITKRVKEQGEGYVLTDLQISWNDFKNCAVVCWTSEFEPEEEV